MAATNNIKTVQTNYKNALDFLETANMWLARYGVLDDDGNVAQFSELASSPAWLFALAAGKMATEWQERLRDAANETDINSCSNDKVLVWAAIAGVQRSAGSPSRIVCTLLNNNALNDITVTATSLWQDAQNGAYWAVEADVTVPRGGQTPMLCSLVNINDGAIHVDNDVQLTNSNFSSITMSVSGCTTGSGLETIAHLRNRILRGEATSDPVIRAQQEIAKLSGIISCNIIVNQSTQLPMTLAGGIVVQPRTAYIAIQGVDVEKKLAQTFYQYLAVPTQKTSTTTEVTYLRGTQPIPVYYDVASYQVCYIRVYVAAGSLSSGQDLTIKRTLLLRTSEIGVGESLTEITVAGWLADLTDLSAQSIDVSTDGNVWRDYIVPNANAALTWTAESISIVEREL